MLKNCLDFLLFVVVFLRISENMATNENIKSCKPPNGCELIELLITEYKAGLRCEEPDNGFDLSVWNHSYEREKCSHVLNKTRVNVVVKVANQNRIFNTRTARILDIKDYFKNLSTISFRFLNIKGIDVESSIHVYYNISDYFLLEL